MFDSMNPKIEKRLPSQIEHEAMIQAACRYFRTEPRFVEIGFVCVIPGIDATEFLVGEVFTPGRDRYLGIVPCETSCAN